MEEDSEHSDDNADTVFNCEIVKGFRHHTNEQSVECLNSSESEEETRKENVPQDVKNIESSTKKKSSHRDNNIFIRQADVVGRLKLYCCTFFSLNDSSASRQQTHFLKRYRITAIFVRSTYRSKRTNEGHIFKA